jgi:hypothetical protein
MRTSESKDTSKPYDSSAALNPKLATHFRQFRASFGFAAPAACGKGRGKGCANAGIATYRDMKRTALMTWLFQGSALRPSGDTSAF